MARLSTFALVLGSTLAGLAFSEGVCRYLERSETKRERATEDENPPWGWRGVRRFGDLETTRTRVMVLGDSFTAGRGVSGTGRDYSTLLGKALDVEMFSYGGEGYSTAQELMVMRRYLGRVRPALVLLQMTTNDLVNNSAELESKSLINNNLKLRPYWENGAMVARYPRFGGSMRVGLVDHSALGRRIFYGLDQGRAWFALRGWMDTVENEINRDVRGHPGFRRSIETTEQLLTLLRDEARPAPLLAFPADGVGAYAPWREELVALCLKLKIPVLDSLPQTVDSLNSAADSVYLPNDSHWSLRGHAIAARELAEWIKPLLAH